MTNSARPKVIVLGGTAGTGKSTIGERLVKFFQDKYPEIQFLEGDRIHPPENVAKMAHGIPLTDDDRWGWLADVAKISTASAEEHGGLAIISCSSLKKKYRDFMREKSPNTDFFFLFLYADMRVIAHRLTQREGHFMKANMLESQFKDLELPNSDEPNCHVVDVDGKDVEQVLQHTYEDLCKFVPN
ncbi:LAFE_0H04434g1_1 [Lachancea fermentati]|uniref:Gluconokinase n=1 Tax=Lachancea fermentati TaxID=4955 RepID=A0A1G4MJG8_LACFM|nr:LAFE_0H04434g1_1 [Lachancea fermentati]